MCACCCSASAAVLRDRWWKKPPTCSAAWGAKPPGSHAWICDGPESKTFKLLIWTPLHPENEPLEHQEGHCQVAPLVAVAGGEPGSPPSPLPAPGAGLAACSGEQPCSPAWQLQCPWEAAQLNSSSLFAGSGILQGLLRGSSALGTSDAANAGAGALPCKAPHSCGVYLFHCSWSQLPVIFQHIYDNERSNSSTFGKKNNPINTHYNLHKIFQQPRLKSVFMCLEFI